MFLSAACVALYHGNCTVSMALHDIFATGSKGNAPATLLFAIGAWRYVIDRSCDLNFKSGAIPFAKSRCRDRLLGLNTTQVHLQSTAEENVSNSKVSVGISLLDFSWMCLQLPPHHRSSQYSTSKDNVKPLVERIPVPQVSIHHLQTHHKS